MAVPVYVVDASVAVIWLSQKDEPAAEQALDLLKEARVGHVRIISSDLLIHEVGNALIFGKKLTGNVLTEAISAFFELPVDRAVTDHNLATQAAAISEQYGMTFYDAVYLALANQQDAPLITANIRDQGKFPGVVVYDIAEWPR